MDTVRLKYIEENKSQQIGAKGDRVDSEISKLVEGAANGDFEAFGELYSIYLDRIYRYIFYQVRDKMTAEDLTEEIFVKAWKALGGYQRNSPTFTAWLYRIAHNHVVDYFRTRRQHQSLDEEMPVATDSPEQEVEEKIMQQELAEAISYLPPQQRQVIILKFIEEMDNREIAQIMRKSEGAIRVMQMRALLALRKKLSSGKNKCELNYLKPLVNA